MSNAPRSAPNGLIESLTVDEAAELLTSLHAQAAGMPPVLDEDDVEQAIEDASDRIVARRRRQNLD
jgi:hypothetical protein